MGEDRTETERSQDSRRVSVAEASEILGITAEAVRTRIKRGKLDSIKDPPDPGGKVYVLRAIEAPQELPEDAETVEEAPDRAEPHSAEVTRGELDTERIRREMAETTLHEGMSEERRRCEEAERERDELRGQLYTRSRQQGAHETAEEQQGRGSNQPAAPGAQEGARRPWWRRMFRG